MWIIGDDFVNDTVGEYLQADDESRPYLRERYDVKVLCSSSLSLNRMVTARIHNNLINSLHEHPLLPKAIVMVLDGDVIKTIFHENMGIAIIFEQVLKNLIAELHRAILSHKEHMPMPVKKSIYPTILWVQAPLHGNFLTKWNIHRKKVQ